jgi:hypothetical protein
MFRVAPTVTVSAEMALYALIFRNKLVNLSF